MFTGRRYNYNNVTIFSVISVGSVVFTRDRHTLVKNHRAHRDHRGFLSHSFPMFYFFSPLNMYPARR